MLKPVIYGSDSNAYFYEMAIFKRVNSFCLVSYSYVIEIHRKSHDLPTAMEHKGKRQKIISIASDRYVLKHQIMSICRVNAYMTHNSVLIEPNCLPPLLIWSVGD